METGSGDFTCRKCGSRTGINVPVYLMKPREVETKCFSREFLYGKIYRGKAFSLQLFALRKVFERDQEIPREGRPHPLHRGFGLDGHSLLRPSEPQVRRLDHRRIPELGSSHAAIRLLRQRREIPQEAHRQGKCLLDAAFQAR